MPWKEVTAVALRKEFIALASLPGSNISELSRRFGISRTTAYKWLERAHSGEANALHNRSTRPHHSPGRTPDAIEALILETRLRYPEWGGRKLKKVLENEGHKGLPSPSTITEILRRNDLLQTTSADHPGPWQRFEHAQPNDLWQMDFKGPIETRRGDAHALTVLDDHSRYSLGIEICRQQIYDDTKTALAAVFRRYGLPYRMTMDNGNPWGNPHGRWTRFAVWLIDQGIQVSYSRPYHPQTQGKDERFHRSLKAELLSRCGFKDAHDLQLRCNEWRVLYNQIRPHESLKMAVPLSRYQSSTRAYQESVAPFEYSTVDAVRTVHGTGQISCKGKIYKISEAFKGQKVGLRPTTEDGIMVVYYRHQRITQLDLRQGNV
jgi:transposase InsO family protein